MDTEPAASYVLTLEGPEQPGLVHAVTGFLVQQRADIRELKQFDDALGARYVARVAFDLSPDLDPGLVALRTALAPVAEQWGLRATLRPRRRGPESW